MSKRSCLSKTLLFFFVLPNVALASVPWMPEYGEVDSGLHVELITSLHTTGPDVTEEDGMPKGWPAASYPRGAPLLVQGLNGTYLYTSLEGGGILRVPPAPSAHYQTAIPYEAYKRIPAMCSGYYCGDEERNWEDEFDEQGRLVRHKGDTIGALVQRANGDLVGAIYAEEEQTGNYGGYAMTEALKNGALYRTDYDATHGTVIAATVGKLISPFGVLVVDGNKVYGTDVGTDGNGRLFRLNEDDSIDFIHDFGPCPDGQKQVPNGFILGQDGALYGVTAYYRGEAFTAGTPTAPSTPTGSLYRIDPNTPESFTVLHSLTLAEGEVMTMHPEKRLQSNSALNWLVEKDGWLYGTVAIGQCQIIPTTNNNARRNNSLCGTEQSSEHWLQPAFPYYDVPETVFGAVYRIRTTGSDFQLLHRFNYDDGATPRGPLAVGVDGYIYGTTVSGGLHESVTNPLISPYPLWVQGRWFSTDNIRWHSSCALYDGICRLEWYSRDGVIYRIVPDQIQVNGDGQVTHGGFELVHHFRRAESGKSPLGIVRGSDGVLYGATANGGGAWISKRGDQHYADRFGTVFMLGAASEASVTLTLNPAEAVVGRQVELTWTSHLAENCVASSSAGDWTGAQAAQGSIDLYPASVGSFTYVLVCTTSDTGAQVSSSIQTLRVGRAATENDGNTVRYKEGGSLSFFFILLLAALMFGRARPAAASVYCGGFNQ